MSRNTRKEIIQRIEEKRCSKVITYVTSDRHNLNAQIASDVIPLIHEHLLSFDIKGPKKLDLFIYSRGGDTDVPWAIVSMFREYSLGGSFSVLIPYKAHSAATVIALGADEIVMTKKAELGPIDATIGSGPYNPTEEKSGNRLPVSVEDVTRYFSLMEKVGCDSSDQKMKGFELLTDKVHPLVLGQVNRLLEQTKLVALRLLSTRTNPYSESENDEIVKKLSSEVYSHRHAINRSESVNYIGLKQVKNAETDDIAEDLWSLYKEYEDLFKLNEPFNPNEYLISNNLEENKWTGLNLACIESVNKCHICRKDLVVKRLRSVPPNININLTNLNFPPVNINNLPKGLNKEQLNTFIQKVVRSVIQTSINDAVKVAAQQVIESLPQTGFQELGLNLGWVEED